MGGGEQVGDLTWCNPDTMMIEDMCAIALVKTGDFTQGDYKVYVLSITGVNGYSNFQIKTEGATITGTDTIFARCEQSIEEYRYDDSKMYGGLRSNTTYRVLLLHGGAGELIYYPNTQTGSAWAIATMQTGYIINEELYLTSICYTNHMTTASRLDVHNGGIFPLDLRNTDIAYMG